MLAIFPAEPCEPDWAREPRFKSAGALPLPPGQRASAHGFRGPTELGGMRVEATSVGGIGGGGGRVGFGRPGASSHNYLLGWLVSPLVCLCRLVWLGLV